MSRAIIVLVLVSLALPALGQNRPQLLVQRGHAAQIVCIAFSSDGRLGATSSDDNTIKLWEAASGRLQRTLRGPETRPSSLAFSPDGRTLVGAGDAEVWTWDVTTGQGRAISKQKVLWANAALSPDGRTLALAGNNQPPLLIEVPSGRVTRTLSGPQIGYGRLTFSRDGSRLLCAVASGLAAWDLSGGGTAQFLGTIPPQAVSTDVVQLSQDGRVGLCAASDVAKTAVQMWDGRTLRPVATFSLPHALAVALSPDGRVIATGHGPFDNVNASIQLWDASTGRHLGSLSAPPEAWALSFTAQGLLASGHQDGSVRVWDVASHVSRAEWLGFASSPSSVAMQPGGSLLAVGHRHGTVALWDLRSGRLANTLEVASAGPKDVVFTAVAFSADGRLLACSGGGGAVDVWDVATTHRISTIRLPHPIVFKILFAGSDIVTMGMAKVDAPDGNGVYVWDARSGQLKNHIWPRVLIRDVAVHPSGLMAIIVAGEKALRFIQPDGKTVGSTLPEEAAGVCFSPSGSHLAIACGHTLYLYDMSARQMRSVPVDYIAFNTPGLAFSQDGRQLLYANGMSTRIIDVADMRVRTLHDEDETPVKGCFVSHFAVTVSVDGTVRFWDLATQHVVALAVQPVRGEWVCMTPGGFFDGSSRGQRMMEWALGDRIFALDQFYNAYFTPGVLALALEGKAPTGPPPSSGQPPPRVRITSPTSGTSVATGTLDVHLTVQDQGGGVSRVGLYLNGHRLKMEARDLVLSGGGPHLAVQLVEGTNTLRATAFNKDGTIESRGDEVTVRWSTSAPRPTLYVIAVGVDRYKAGMNLNYARADAAAMASFFKPGLFQDVRATLLVDEQATRDNILAAFADVAKKASPRDVVLVYLSGHGTLVGDLFYYLPHDVRVGSDDELRKSGLAQTELGEALTSIAATKQFLIIDACHSGASAGSLGKLLARRDAIGLIRAQQRLARSSGSFLIAASTAEQVAYEVKELHHGVLTYAVLTALGGAGPPAARLNGDGQVTANALLQYVSEEVPKLSEKYQHQRQDVVQGSTGQDFPLVVKP